MVTTCDMEHAAIAGSTGGGSVILLKDKTYDADSLMAFLNSSVAEWSMRQVAPVRRGGWMLLEQSVLKTVPIPNFLTQKKSFARSELSRLASIARARMRESTGYQSQESRQQLSAVEDQIDSLIIGALGLDARDGTYIRRRVLALRGSKGDKIQEPGLL
jgi:hypothetical protein